MEFIDRRGILCDVTGRRLVFNELICDSLLLFIHRMVCDLGYRTLTHPSVGEKRVNDTAFHLFGVAIERYNHAMVFTLRIMEILQRQENAVSPITRGIQLLADEHGITTVFNDLLKEFVDQLNVASPDATAAKNFSRFLTEMAELCPQLMLPVLSPDSDVCDEMLDLEV